MFKNTTVFSGEEAQEAKASLPTLPEGIAYHWEESDFVRSWWK